MNVRRIASAAVLTWVILVPASRAQVGFNSALNFAAGDAPQDLAIGDFDGDDALDLAVASRDDDSVRILRNAGSAVFLSTQTIEFDALARPSALLAGDFNNDDLPDLAVALEGSDQVGVLPGTALGVFGAAALFDVGDSPRAIATADFNGDGNLDIVTANREDDTASVLLGNGDFTFDAAIAVALLSAADAATRAQPEGVAAGDFDQDGNPDLAVSRSSNTHSDVVILAGAGDGTFGEPGDLDAGQDPRGVVAADVTGDGTLDLLVGNNDSDDVSVIAGDGGGTFAAAANFPAGNAPEALAVRDMDGDGDLDIVTANREGDNVSVLLNDGEGAFGDPSDARTGGAPNGVVLGDLNGDGDVDVATANEEGDTVSVLRSRGVVPGDGDGTDGGLLDECNFGCGPMGATPLLLTMCGLAGMRRAVRRGRGA